MANGVLKDHELVSIRKEDLDSLTATMETLADHDVMKQIRESDEAIKAGKVSSARNFLEELD